MAPELMTELRKAIDAIENIRESNRTSPFVNHFNAIVEGIGALSWIFQPKPAAFVGEIVGAIQYYGNNVIKTYKDK